MLDVRSNNPYKLNQKLFDNVIKEFQLWFPKLELVFDEAGDRLFKPGKSLDKLSYDGLILPNINGGHNYLFFDSAQIRVVT